jgi:hypothetical protein
VTAINNSPGTYAIDFAPSLKGMTINVGSWNNQELPHLSSGNLTLNGDSDSDGRPDVTINNTLSQLHTFAFHIASSYNTLYSLDIENFWIGVVFNAPAPGTSISNTTLSNLKIGSTLPGSGGIELDTGPAAGASVNGEGILNTHNRWTNTIIANNTISTNNVGIAFFYDSASDQVLRTQIIGNNVTFTTPGAAQAINLALGGGAGSNGNDAKDIAIAYNSIRGAPIDAIRVAAGENGGSNNRISSVEVAGNKFYSTSPTSPTARRVRRP